MVSLPAEGRGVESLGGLRVFGVQVAEVPGAGLVDPLRAGAPTRLPQPKARARRVRADGQPAARPRVLSARQQRAAVFDHHGGSRVGVFDRDIGVPRGGVPLDRRDSGDVLPVQTGHAVGARRLSGNDVFELPSEQLAVELAVPSPDRKSNV